MNLRFNSSGRHSNLPDLMSSFMIKLSTSIISEFFLSFIEKGVFMEKMQYFILLVALLMVAVQVN